MKTKKSYRAMSLLAIPVLTAALAACSAKEGGPAQNAGRKIDNATESLGEKMQDAGEEMQEKARGD